MWIKAGALGEPGSRSSNLALWTMAGLGIAIGLYSSRKWVEYFNRKLGVLARGENDNGIDRLPDDILCDIVSRLEIIEASRTSILSRRWRKIWTMNYNRNVQTCPYNLEDAARNLPPLKDFLIQTTYQHQDFMSCYIRLSIRGSGSMEFRSSFA